MTTAIIGLGNIGSCLARNLVTGGQRIILADRTLAKAQQLARELGGNAAAMSVAGAIGETDVVILAIPFDAIKRLISEYSAGLVEKIIVDPSNPIALDGEGGFRKIIAADQSAGQVIAGLLPKGAELVKAFGTLGAESLASGANRSPQHAVLFYATDDPRAGKVVANLITASGFSPVPIGGIATSIRIEVGGDLHEFGKLGKLVSVEEAESLI
jgi:predicted dinucleotide-binding enzyme